MQRFKRGLFLAVSTCLVAIAPLAHADAQATTKVVMQIDDNDPHKWNLALNNAANIQAELGVSHTEIDIVAYGPGLNMLKKGSPVADRIDTENLAGIHFEACHNTMNAMHLSKQDLVPAATVVPSGAVQIIKKQQQGFAYLRP